MDWMDDGTCVTSKTNVDFFAASSEKYTELEKQQHTEAAKSLCSICPVRRECLTLCLKTENRFGVWGGLDETEIRATLNIDQYGKPTKNEYVAFCPYCKSRKVVVLSEHRTKKHTRCSVCHFDWYSRIPSKTIQIEVEEDDDEDLG